MRIRVLNAEPEGYSREAFDLLSSASDVVERKTSQADLKEAARDFDALIVRVGLEVNQEIIESAVKLRYILSATTGLDHIDLDVAARRGIEVISLKGERDFLRTITSTAEHTWGLLLSLIRNIPASFESTLLGEWDRQKFRGHTLFGKTMGIAGLGRVGEQVAGYAKAFGMNVHAYDPYREDWPEFVTRHNNVDALVSQSDVLSIHVPLDSKTNNFFNRELLSKTKNGAFLVNTARAGIWDELAIFEFLSSGHLAGVATDVLDSERENSVRVKNPLISYAKLHSNLVITPHLAGATKESMERTELFIATKFIQKITNTHE